MPSIYPSPNTPLPRYIPALIPSTPFRCTHTPKRAFHPDVSPKLSHIPSNYKHPHTHIHTRIHDQSSYNTPPRYALLHIPPPKNTCSFTHPPFRYTHIKTHSTQMIPPHCLTHSPHVPLQSLTHHLHTSHKRCPDTLTHNPQPSYTQTLTTIQLHLHIPPTRYIYAVTHPPHSESPTLFYTYTQSRSLSLKHLIVFKHHNTHTPHTQCRYTHTLSHL